MREAIRTIVLWAICIFWLSTEGAAQICSAAAGNFLTPNMITCPNDSIQATINGAFVGNGYVTEFWLCDTNRIFLAKASSTGKFAPKSSGKYLIYAYNFDQSNNAQFPPQIDSSTARVKLSAAGCFALSDSLVVLIKDSTRPTAVCQSVQIYLNSSGVAVVDAETMGLGSNDNCGALKSFEASPSRFTCANLGENLVILTVRDSSDNISICSATVTVLDTLKPLAKCKNITVFLDEEGTVSVRPKDVDDESVDNCGTPESLTISKSDFTCADIGVQSVTLTVTDRSGNQQICVAKVTVRDTIKPQVECRTTTLFLGSDGQARLLPTLITASSSDNCGALSYRLSRSIFSCADRGQTQVTLYATDAGGNIDSCTTTITVVDQVKPTARCKNINVYLDATGKAVVNPAQINNGSTDNCVLDSLVLSKISFTCENLGENLVTFTVYDAQRNSASCLASIMVLDTLRPAFQCASDLLVNSNQDGDKDCGYTVTSNRLDPTNLNDNCGIKRVYHNYVAAPKDTTLQGATFPLGLTEIIWTIEDNQGLKQTCTIKVTVKDVLPPVPVCKDTVLVQLGVNGTIRIDSTTVDNGSYDNCGIAQFTINKVDFSCQNIGFQRIVLTLKDASGNTATKTIVLGILAGTACPAPKITNSKGPKIGDPCTCRGNGAFDEEIVIGPALPNQIWRVKSTTLRDTVNLNVYAAGTLFREVKIKPDSSIYVLRGVHLDGQGYRLEAESPLFSNTLSISNLCKYPKPQFFDLDNPICLFTPAISLTGNGGAGVQGSGSFKINGQSATVFNPKTLGIGKHQVSYTFDAGNSAGKLEPKDVGCTTVLTKQVEVLNTQPNFTCFTDISINVNNSCEILITPDMLMVNKFACYDDFEVILNVDNQLVPNPVPAVYAGRTLVGFVRFKPNLNVASCRTKVVLRDITGPEIQFCPGSKANMLCTDFDSIFNNVKTIDPTFRNYTGRPIVQDNCTGTTLTFNDVVVNFANCHPNYVKGIIRTFTAKDKFGNASTCVQQFFFRRPATINFPNDTLVKTDCANPALPNDALGNLSPNISGKPWFFNGFGKKVYIDNSSNLCNYAANYTDERIPVCGSRYALLRTWRILDGCDPSSLLEKRQYIEVGDFDAPIVSNPELDLDKNWIIDDTLRYSVAPFNCLATFALPVPKIRDCSSTTVATEIYSWQPETISGFPTGRIIWAKLDLPIVNGQVQNVPLGTHYFIFKVRDICNQLTVDSVAFKVLDRIAPTMICNNVLKVSLSGGGTARIFTSDINKPSRDNCDNTNLKLEVRRLFTAECGPNGIQEYSEWGDFADLTCCDVGKLATIELRGTDRFGNFNTCITRFIVEDNLNPICTPPADQLINCDALPIGFSPTNLGELQARFGVPTVFDNCSATWEELPPAVALNNCGLGSITRKFRAKDAIGNFSDQICEQVISVLAVHNYEIKFPKDAVSYCRTPVADTLFLDELACDELAFNVEDKQFTVNGGGCYQILRTYQIINLCEYDGASPPTILSRDMDCDQIAGDEDLWLMVRPNGVTYLDKDNRETNVFPRNNERGRSCDRLGNPIGHWSSSNINPALKSKGFWQYTQFITVIDTVKPKIMYNQPAPYCSNNSTTCDAAVDLPFAINENCTPGNLQIKVWVDLNNDGSLDRQLAATEIQGIYPNYRIKGTYALGTHSYRVEVRDACGNTGVQVLVFKVIDCKAPSPICISGITVTLQALVPARDIDGDGKEDLAYAVVKATDFIASPSQDCTGPVRYSINREGAKPNLKQDTLLLTCTDEGTVIVEVYAWDSANNPFALQPDGRLGGPNGDYCLNFINVQNSGEICVPVPQGALGGVVQTELYQAMSNVEVTLSGQASNRTNTTPDGNYVFNNLIEGNDYTLTPRLNTDHVNGVSTFDLILIRKHILNVGALNSPYKLIAADANASKTVTTLDMISIQKLILNLDPAFKNNTSWRFVDANYHFPDPTNPWAQNFPESFSVNNLSGKKLSASFIAVKIGDVNGSANLGLQATPEVRSENEPLWIDLDDQMLQVGQEYTVAFRVKDLATVQGYQFGLSYAKNQVELTDIRYGLAKPENFGVFKEEGLITTNWYTDQAQLNPDAVLFTLVFRAQVSGKLSQILRLSQRRMLSEAYDFADERKPVQLRFNNNLVQDQTFELYQNIPNPFQDATSIRFYLPETTDGHLLIFDAAGRLLQDLKGNYQRGLNQIDLLALQLPSGVLYYTFRSTRYTATKKMQRIGF